MLMWRYPEMRFDIFELHRMDAGAEVPEGPAKKKIRLEGPLCVHTS